MIDLTQTLLVIVIVVLTVILSIIGVQIIFILKDLRRTMAKLSSVVDEAGTIVNRLSHPIQSASGLIAGVKQGTKIIETISDIIARRREPEQLEDMPYR